MSLLRDIKFVSRDKSVDLTGVFIMSRDIIWMFATKLFQPTTSFYDLTSQAGSVDFRPWASLIYCFLEP